MIPPKLGNYKIFLLSNSLLYFSWGLFQPFWIVFVQKIGGSIEQLGFSIGLMVLAQSITSYFVGKRSDLLGRKKFLIFSGFFMSGVIFAYTLITSLFQLYILQVLYGIVGAMQATMEQAFLGDITKKASRGTDIGKYHALVGVMAGIAMMGGGILVESSGFKVIFYIVAVLVFIYTLMLFYIKE